MDLAKEVTVGTVGYKFETTDGWGTMFHIPTMP